MEPAPPPGRKTPPAIGKLEILRVGFLFVLPLYFFVAWAVFHWGGDRPLIDQAYRFAGFAAACAPGLGGAVLSAWMRSRFQARSSGSPGRAEVRGLLAGLAGSELSVFLGLIYFVFFRDWIGFGFLALASLAGFLFHATWTGSEAGD